MTASSTGLQAQTKAGKATLNGLLRNFGAVVEVENFSDLQNMVSSGQNPVIVPGKDSLFSITIPLSAPCYFRIGRNKIYLSPGDSMTVLIDRSLPTASLFSGKGSIANNYLRNVPFPKGGSFLEAGKFLLAAPEETLAYIITKTTEKNKELQSLKGVSKTFIRLEKARNRADAVNSIASVQNYAPYKFKKEEKAFIDKYIADFNKIANPVKDSLVNHFMDPFFLQLEVYRDIYEELNLNGKQNAAQLQVMKDWNRANSLAFDKIKPLNDKSKIPELQQQADSVKTKKYRQALKQLLAAKAKFGNGDPVLDFAVINNDKTITNLSSLKGKVIYIDIWATWCGPCLAEMPHLEELKEKYKENSDLAIVSLSVDDNDEVWLRNLDKRNPGGIQWRVDRPKLADYDVETIPRYILIDKNFNIAEMNAPGASDKKIADLIDKLISAKIK